MTAQAQQWGKNSHGSTELTHLGAAAPVFSAHESPLPLSRTSPDADIHRPLGSWLQSAVRQLRATHRAFGGGPVDREPTLGITAQRGSLKVGPSCALAWISSSRKHCRRAGAAWRRQRTGSPLRSLRERVGASPTHGSRLFYLLDGRFHPVR